MGKIVSGAADLWGIGPSKDHTTTASYDPKQGTYGVNLGDLGASKIVQNPDGTWSKTVTQGATDKARNQAISGIFSNFSGDGADQAQSFYDAQTRLLEPQFERQQENLDRNLINRGINVGNENYQRAMTDLLNQQDTQRANIADNSVFSGQNYATNQINQANQISSGRDLNTLLSMMGENTGYTNYINNQSQRNAEAEAYKNQRSNNILGGLFGI